MSGPTSPYGEGFKYTYDYDRHILVCACGFEITREESFSATKELYDKLTVHAIAHRLIDD